MRIRKNKKQRTSRYGYPILPPVQDDPNTTPYGGKRFRTPVTDEFVHPAGTRPQAVVLDIDGTLEDWGATASQTVLDWMEGHYKKARIFIVITARTHEHDYERSFDWLVKHVPYPFIGPFHRSKDDPRYASEFKRETIETLAQIYDIVGAAEDNRYVLDMYRHWMQGNPDFDLLECGYSAAHTSQSGWDDYDRWENDYWFTSGSDHLDSKTERLDLEDEVYSTHLDLTMTEIQAMDIETLRKMVADPILDDEAEGVL